MPGPYVRDDHYLYGSSLNQPYPSYYNAAWLHKKPKTRRLEGLMTYFDDDSVYKPSNMIGDPNDDIIRFPNKYNLINIETIRFSSLRIKLYAMKEEDDVDIVLELGKRYSVTYLTEGGLAVTTGILKVIDSTIPDTCVRYVGNYNETVATAWIGIDASTVGNSNKLKIYVASIRGIEEAPIDDPSYVPPVIDTDVLTDSQKLARLIDLFSLFDNRLNQILTKVADNDQIMGKLEELNPTEKLDIIMNLITIKAEEVSSTIDAAKDTVIRNTNDGFHNVQADIQTMQTEVQASGFQVTEINE